MSAIAIVGMGCRFAGAEDLQGYWRLVREGRHAFGPVPEDRWPADAFYDTNRRATDKTYAPAGGFFQDIKSFPALALGLPPRRVEVMDPQQRFTLETSIAAIEDGGYLPADLPSRTGVFVGITAHEYRALLGTRAAAMLLATGAIGRTPEEQRFLQGLTESVENVVPSRPYSAPGVLGNMSAAAVAQELDLHGPAYTTDAACASAHMAVYDAVQQLRTGAIDVALAGGAYVQLMPDHYIAFARIGAMSASGVCRPFDHRADGFVQGDGVGMVLLKRLEDAERDGDRIYAVLHGAAINNDGRGDGPMAPVQAGQVDCIDRAWQDAGLDKAHLGYMEAHGTGTAVGDPTEMDSLSRVFGDQVERVALGSAKGNVGHTMSAAGIAGLIRATLAVHHGVIPPMANFEAPNPKLNLDALPFDVPTATEDWEGHARVAACSAFGFGGTNGHIVLGNHTRDHRAGARIHVSRPDPRPELVLMSAPDQDTLQVLAGRTAAALEDQPTATVAGVARAWARRPRQATRLGVVATTRDELIDKLREVADGGLPRGAKLGEAPEDPAKIAFLFPGQGAQRIDMLRDARDRFPVIAETLDRLEAELGDALPVPLTHLLYPDLRDETVEDDIATAQLTDTRHTQPVMLAAGLALDALLRTVGVTPHVVLGHSLGEFVAAAAGGVVEPGDAIRFVTARGRAMADLDGDHGAMAAIMADRGTVEDLLVDGAVIANINHPRQLVVSGFSDAVATVVDNARAADVKAKSLTVSHGFHSPALHHLDSGPLLEGITLQDPDLPVASGIADHPYANAAEARDVFQRHATSPVEFVRALHQCRDLGADLFLQVGAGGPLASFTRGSLPRDHRGTLTLAGKNDRDGGASLLEAWPICGSAAPMSTSCRSPPMRCCRASRRPSSRARTTGPSSPSLSCPSKSETSSPVPARPPRAPPSVSRPSPARSAPTASRIRSWRSSPGSVPTRSRPSSRAWASSTTWVSTA